ncbi:MAG: hypothetical protein Q8P13_04485 [bacterium]|nr:hypothetical protein [bacterium]
MAINKRVAFGFLTIAATLAAVVGITLAVFTDTATLSNNTLSTGDADLQIAEWTGSACGSFASSTPGIDSDDLAPGQEEVLPFCLKNNSDSAISLDITAATSIDSGALDPSLVTVALDCGSGVVSGTLDAPFPGTTIVTIAPDAEVGCNIKQTLSGSATNSASNKSIQYDVVFTGTQVVP